jgi:RNA polymerase sigma factor (sigma-70 family)
MVQLTIKPLRWVLGVFMSAHPLDPFDSLLSSRPLSSHAEELQAQYGIAGINDHNSNFVSILNSASFENRLSDPEHLRRITQIAYKQTRCTNVDWQDALQTAQLKLIKGLRAGKFTGTEAEFDRWALTVAKFAIIDLVRSSMRHHTQSIDRLSEDNLAIIDTLTNFNDEFAHIESADLAWQVWERVLYLDRLYPTRSYYQLWVGKVNDQSQAEIARELGLTQGTISKRWQKLITHLSLELGMDLAIGKGSSVLSETQVRSQQQ